MTTVNLAAIAAALQIEFEPEIISNINRAAPLLSVMRKRNYRGQNITWPVRFGVASAGSAAAVAEGATVTVFNTDTKIPAVLQYAEYQEAFTITGLAAAVAANSSDPAALVDLFQEEVTSASERLAKALAEELYTGTGAANRMLGLLATAGGLAATGTYAGLSRVTYTQWASTVLSNGAVARPLSLALMREAMRSAFIASGRRPDLIVCDSVQFDKYGALLDGQRQYVDSIRTAGSGVITLDGGFRALMFDGRPVIEDINCPAGKMLFLNTTRVEFGQLVQPDLMGAGTSDAPLNAGADDKSDGRLDLSVKIIPLAIVGNSFPFALSAIVQPVVKQCNAHAVLTDLALT